MNDYRIDPPLQAAAENWCLVGHLPGTEGRTRIAVTQSPFRVGRYPSNDLEVVEPSVSSIHGLFLKKEADLWVVDLGSTNGTCVNGERITCARKLEPGDVVQFATIGFSIEHGPTPEAHLASTKRLSGEAQSLVEQARLIGELMADRAVCTQFQPLVRTGDRRVVGYEALARGSHPNLPTSPIALFELASLRDQEAELSELFREKALEALKLYRVDHLGEGPWTTLYTNVHPKEIETGRLLPSLSELQREYPWVQLIVEINEQSILSVAQTRELVNELRARGIGVAFDDFGSGVSRLAELADCPPDILKFDASLINGLCTDRRSMVHVVGTLVSLARELGCVTTAEGVETEDQFQFCRELGFDLVQGYHLGRPAALAKHFSNQEVEAETPLLLSHRGSSRMRQCHDQSHQAPQPSPA